MYIFELRVLQDYQARREKKNFSFVIFAINVSNVKKKHEKDRYIASMVFLFALLNQCSAVQWGRFLCSTFTA